MATLLQSAATNNSSPGAVNSAQLTYGANVTAGSLVVCALAVSSGTAATLGVSDNHNGAWINGVQTFNTNNNIAIFYFPNSIGGALTVTCTQTGSPTVMRFGLQEWNQAVSLNPLDQIASATGSSITPSSGNTPSTSQPNELVIGAISGGGAATSISAGGAATLDAQLVGRWGIEYQIVGTVGAQSSVFTYNTSDTAAVVCATFKILGSSIDTLLGQGWV